MKKLLLSVLLAFVLVIPAYAVERDDPAAELRPVTVGTLEELQEAIAAAKDGDTIYVSAEIKLRNLTLETQQDITITRADGYAGRIFRIYDDAVVDGFTFSDNGSAEGGIIIVDTATNQGIRLQNCNFLHEGEKSLQFLRITGGNKAKISHCIFDGATYQAISIMSNTDVEIETCTLRGNTYSLTGGAVQTSGKLLIRDSTFTDNAANAGGAVYSSGDLTLENCQFYGNLIKAPKFGKDVFSMGTLTISDEQQEEAGFYDDVSGEKYVLPLDSFSGTAKLAYLTTEQAAEYFAPPAPPQDDSDDPDDPGEDDGEDTPETPQEPGDQEDGTDTTDDENPSQEPTEDGTGEEKQQEPQDQDKDDPADNPEDTDNSDDQQDSKSDDPQDTPSEPEETTPEPSNDDSSDDDYTPPYRPSRPSNPVVTVNPEPEPEAEEQQTQDDPAPIRQLVCGEAQIDTSRTIVLLGYGDGQAHEDEPLTRAQMATIIYRLLDDDTIARYSEGTSNFTDVAPGAWYAPFVQIINRAGIVNGVGGGNYAPDGLVTWAQIVTVLSRFVEPQDYTLQYISYNGWAQSAVQTAVALGWIEDSADFDPNAIISRGELVQLVNSVLEQYRA